MDVNEWKVVLGVVDHAEFISGLYFALKEFIHCVLEHFL